MNVCPLSLGAFLLFSLVKRLEKHLALDCSMLLIGACLDLFGVLNLGDSAAPDARCDLVMHVLICIRIAGTALFTLAVTLPDGVSMSQNREDFIRHVLLSLVALLPDVTSITLEYPDRQILVNMASID